MDKESDSYSVSPSQDTGRWFSAGLHSENGTAVAAVTFLVLEVLLLVLRCHYFFLARVFFCRLFIRGVPQMHIVLMITNIGFSCHTCIVESFKRYGGNFSCS